MDLQLWWEPGTATFSPGATSVPLGTSPRARAASAGRVGAFTFPSSFTLLLRSSKGLERAESGSRVSVLPWEGPATLSGVKDDISPRTPTGCEAGGETGDSDTK